MESFQPHPLATIGETCRLDLCDQLAPVPPHHGQACLLLSPVPRDLSLSPGTPSLSLSCPVPVSHLTPPSTWLWLACPPMCLLACPAVPLAPVTRAIIGSGNLSMGDTSAHPCLDLLFFPPAKGYWLANRGGWVWGQQVVGGLGVETAGSSLLGQPNTGEGQGWYF